MVRHFDSEVIFRDKNTPIDALSIAGFSDLTNFFLS